MHDAVKMRHEKMSYKNFNVAIYCPVENINHVEDLEAFDKQFEFMTKNMKVGRVYLECYRGLRWCSKEQLIRMRDYFEGKGIATSGGITTNDDGRGMGFVSLCYSTDKGKDILTKAVRLSAEVFDELIFDDFFFTNCRCEACVAEKGKRSWREFRLAQKKWVTDEIIMKNAKEVNPKINVIIKYPQWYESYNETGYDLMTEPASFDTIYTGTETRNPEYAQQHLPKYLSYTTMRYLESAAPGRNLGGWFDPYECTYNLTSYLEQGYLTLFSKTKEATLFCLGSLMNDPAYQTFVPAVGKLFEETDAYLGKLGNPYGIAAYRPGYGVGEDMLHNYLGMCGLPLDLCLFYPEDAKAIFLAESASGDCDIIEKIHNSLMKGADVVVTSGFIRKMGKAFADAFVNVTVSDRKAFVNKYANTKDNGLSINGKYTGGDKIIIPQLDYYTNDIWELAAAFGNNNNFPIVLRCEYGSGTISIITIPDDYGDLYQYPAEVWNTIRSLYDKTIPVSLEGPSGAMLFLYDNNTCIVRSDLPYTESFTLKLPENVTKVCDLVTGREYAVAQGSLALQLVPSVNYVLAYS